MKRCIHYGMPAVLVFLLLSSCTSMPRASSPGHSLIVFISDLELSSPDTMDVTSDDGEQKVSFGKQGIAFCQVLPGTLQVGGTAPLDVPAGALLLYPRVMGPDGPVREVLPADQRRAMEALTRFVGFEEWFGREYINFGPFRPKQYLSGEYFPLELDSDPEGSLILIDDVAWGETPQTIELNAGKYLVEISAPGFRSFKRIVTVDGPLSLSPELEKIEKDSPPDQEQFDIMVAPIRSMNPDEDLYGDLIASTMLANFEAVSRLKPISIESVSVSEEYPDFGPAEEAGADLLVAGRYNIDGDSIYLEAVLYEATTRRVKFAETYLSETGFAVFDSIDEISAQFADAVSRTLPSPGEPIIEREADGSGQLLVYEKSIYRQRMVESRLEKRNLLSLKTGMGGLDDSYEYIPGESIRLAGSGGINQVQLDYQRVMTDMVSLSVKSSVIWGSPGVDNGSLTNAPGTIFSFALLFGPELAFRSETSDVYFTPALLLGIQPPFSITATLDYDIPARYYTGLELDVGYRYFFFPDRDSRPMFLNLGMFFNMIEYAFSGGSNPGLQMIPIRGALYLGGGAAF